MNLLRYRYSCLIVIIMISNFSYSCKSSTNKISHEINFNFEDHKQGLKLTDVFESITFIELDKLFSNTSPNKIKCRSEKYFVYWRYNKIGVFNKRGTLLDSLKSEPNTSSYIGNIHDFEIFKDSMFVLTGENIYVYSLTNLYKPIRSVSLPYYYDTFTVNNLGFILYSPIADNLLYFSDFNGIIINKVFPTANKLPNIRKDAFPHFTRINRNNVLLFYRQFYPIIYNININDGTIKEYLSINLGNFKINQDELNSLIQDPKNFENEMKIANSKFSFFNKIEEIKNGLMFNYKINGKFYNTLFSSTSGKVLTFNHFINDTNIPFINNKQIIDVTGTDNNSNLIFYLEPELLIPTIKSFKRISSNKMNSNWNEIENRICWTSGPILAVMKLKDSY